MMKLCLYVCIVAVCQALNVQDQMYVQLEVMNYCVLRLNGSQSFGCTSSRGGNVGVIHMAYNESSLNWVLNSPQVDSYIVVLPLISFDFQTLVKLNASQHVNGVLVVRKQKLSEKMKNFSPENRCPNRYSGLAGPGRREQVCNVNAAWNSKGNDMALHKWDMPIFFTDDPNTIDEVEDCFSKFNLPLDTQTDRALCALELNSHMLASVDSTTCIRRSSSRYNVNTVRYCDVLGNKNIYAPTIPLDKYKNSANGSYIFVTARLDSTSLFYGRAPGALSTATSLVTLLLTSNLLSRLLTDTPQDNYKKNVLFMLFNGEAYDYIGSGRTVYDMQHSLFPSKEKPITLDDVGLFIELSQLRNDQPVTYHTYRNTSSANSQAVQDFVDKFQEMEQSLGLDFPVQPNNEATFPPSSYQSFLTHKDIGGFVFASYKKNYVNNYYHSIFDDASKVGYTYANGSAIPKTSLQGFVANFSSVLAHTLFEQITGGKGPLNVNNSYELADEILYCFLETVNCKFFADSGADTSSSLGESVLDYYVGVERQSTLMTEAARFSLSYMMGKKVNVSSQEDCLKRRDADYNVLWLEGQKVCLQNTVNVTDAVSPAFILPEYKLDEGLYSSWTESSWQSPTMRLFLKPSSKYEWLVFIVGTFIIVSCFAILYWINRNAKELFNYPHLMSSSSL